jgi:hypothetical protein
MDTSAMNSNGQQHARDEGVLALALRWTPLLLLLAVVAIGYYSSSTRRALEERLANVERASGDRVAEATTLRSDTDALRQRLDTLDSRFSETSQQLKATEATATNLRRADERLARGVATNAEGITAMKEGTAGQVAIVDKKVGTVSAQVQEIATRVDSTRADVTANRLALTQKATELSGQIGKNAAALAELRRKGEQDVFEFDIQKSGGNDVARVGDVRIQVTKADERRARYNVVLYVDDRRVEKKDLLMNEPLQFLVGKDRLRYELVVTDVDHDRIRGYVSAPKERAQAVALAVTEP